MIARVVAVITAGVVVAGCGSPAGRPVLVTPSPCAAPALAPRFLPRGVRPTKPRPLIGQPERSRAWAGGSVFVQLDEGFSADHGDDPSVKTVTVRGDRFANYVRYTTGGYAEADWAEETRCGHTQYAVSTLGLDETETLKIARSVR